MAEEAILVKKEKKFLENGVTDYTLSRDKFKIYFLFYLKFLLKYIKNI